MTDKLTATFIKASGAILSPKDIDEAAIIQRWMFKHGIYWKIDTKPDEPSFLYKCVEKRMLIRGGNIFHGPDHEGYPTVSIDQLEGIESEEFLSREQRLQRRIDGLESEVAGLRNRLDQLIEMLAPAKLEKPASVVKKARHQP